MNVIVMWRCGLVTVDQSIHTDDAADGDSAHITSAAGRNYMPKSPLKSQSINHVNI